MAVVLSLLLLLPTVELEASWPCHPYGGDSGDAHAAHLVGDAPAASGSGTEHERPRSHLPGHEDCCIGSCDVSSRGFLTAPTSGWLDSAPEPDQVLAAAARALPPHRRPSFILPFSTAPPA